MPADASASTVAARPAGAAGQVVHATGEAADALWRLGSQLRQVAHPSVAEVVRLDRDGGRVELEFAPAPGPTWRERPPAAAAALALAAAGLAATLAELRDAQISLGPIGAEHLATGRHGRAVLVGITPPGDDRPDADADADVASLGAVVLGLLERLPSNERHAAERLRPIAERAQANELDARTLAALLRRASLAAGSSTGRTAPEHRASTLRLVGVLAALVAAALALVVVTPSSTRSLRAGPVELTADNDDGNNEPAGQSTTPPASAPSSTVSTTSPVALATSSAAPLVVVGGQRFSVGEPGDVALVGDWRCDRVPTVALLRPSTGEVFVFDRWPDAPGSTITTTTVQRVRGATALTMLEQADGCPRLAVQTADGLRTVEVPR